MLAIWAARDAEDTGGFPQKLIQISLSIQIRLLLIIESLSLCKRHNFLSDGDEEEDVGWSDSSRQSGSSPWPGNDTVKNRELLGEARQSELNSLSRPPRPAVGVDCGRPTKGGEETTSSSLPLSSSSQ